MVEIAFPSSRLFTNTNVRRFGPAALPSAMSARVAARASGFIYAVSRAGVTGARTNVSAEAEKLVARVRQFSDLPVAVGFGISTPEQAAAVARGAGGVVVGSAIVRRQ